MNILARVSEYISCVPRDSIESIRAHSCIYCVWGPALMSFSRCQRFVGSRFRGRRPPEASCKHVVGCKEAQAGGREGACVRACSVHMWAERGHAAKLL